MTEVTALLVLICAALASGQRPFFAGSRPIGYPELTTTEGLGDRFGEVDGTTQRLPIEANGNRELIESLSKLPIDKQPFWFINWQALEANRQKPQTYPQRPNQFIDTPPMSGSNFNSANANSHSNANANSNSASCSSQSTASSNSGFVSSNRFGAEEYPIEDKRNTISENNSNSGSSNTNSGNANSNSGNANSNSGNANSNSGNANSNSSAGNSGVTSNDKKKPAIENTTYYTRPAYYL